MLFCDGFLLRGFVMDRLVSLFMTIYTNLPSSLLYIYICTLFRFYTWFYITTNPGDDVWLLP
jgi:hypothetical protein